MSTSIPELSRAHSLQPVRIPTLLREARDLAQAEASAKQIVIVLVAVEDEVHVARLHVLEIVATLLRDAVCAAPVGGRVAITGQQVERELVVAIYNSAGAKATTRRFECTGAESAAAAVGGRVWTTEQSKGNVCVLALPVLADDMPTESSQDTTFE